MPASRVFGGRIDSRTGLRRWLVPTSLRWTRLAAPLLLLQAAVPGVPRAVPVQPLRLVMVDVEGGAATLLVTPQGRSVLIDAGWPSGFRGADPSQSSATRIMAATRALGVNRIDYLIVTHYHLDHVGGVADLLARIPVGTVIDHGPNRELPAAGAAPGPDDAAALYARYEGAIAAHPHRIVKPGERIVTGSLVIDIVAADRAVLVRKGRSGAGCADARLADQGNGGEENPRAIGIVAHFGAVRIVSLADVTADVEWGCSAQRTGSAGPIC